MMGNWFVSWTTLTTGASVRRLQSEVGESDRDNTIMIYVCFAVTFVTGLALVLPRTACRRICRRERPARLEVADEVTAVDRNAEGAPRDLAEGGDVESQTDMGLQGVVPYVASGAQNEIQNGASRIYKPEHCEAQASLVRGGETLM